MNLLITTFAYFFTIFHVEANGSETTFPLLITYNKTDHLNVAIVLKNVPPGGIGNTNVTCFYGLKHKGRIHSTIERYKDTAVVDIHQKLIASYKFISIKVGWETEAGLRNNRTILKGRRVNANTGNANHDICLKERCIIEVDFKNSNNNVSIIMRTSTDCLNDICVASKPLITSNSEQFNETGNISNIINATGNTLDKINATGNTSDKINATGNTSDKINATGNTSDKINATGINLDQSYPYHLGYNIGDDDLDMVINLHIPPARTCAVYVTYQTDVHGKRTTTDVYSGSRIILVKKQALKCYRISVKVALQTDAGVCQQNILEGISSDKINATGFALIDTCVAERCFVNVNLTNGSYKENNIPFHIWSATRCYGKSCNMGNSTRDINELDQQRFLYWENMFNLPNTPEVWARETPRYIPRGVEATTPTPELQTLKNEVEPTETRYLSMKLYTNIGVSSSPAKALILSVMFSSIILSF